MTLAVEGQAKWQSKIQLPGALMQQMYVVKRLGRC